MCLKAGSAGIEIVLAKLQKAQSDALVNVLVGELGNVLDQALPEVLALGEARSVLTRRRVARVLGHARGSQAPLAFDALLKLLQDEDRLSREMAASELWRVGESLQRPRGISVLAAALDHEDPVVREGSVECLGVFVKTQSDLGQIITPMLKDSERTVRRAAVGAIGRMSAPPREAVPLILQLLRQREAVPLCLGALTMAAPEDKRLLLELDSLLAEDTYLVCVGLALARIKQCLPQTVSRLKRLAGSEKTRSRLIGRYALFAIRGDRQPLFDTVKAMLRAVRLISNEEAALLADILVQCGDESRVLMPDLLNAIESIQDDWSLGFKRNALKRAYGQLAR